MIQTLWLSCMCCDSRRRYETDGHLNLSNLGFIACKLSMPRRRYHNSSNISEIFFLTFFTGIEFSSIEELRYISVLLSKSNPGDRFSISYENCLSVTWLCKTLKQMADCAIEDDSVYDHITMLIHTCEQRATLFAICHSFRRAGLVPDIWTRPRRLIPKDENCP
jgi:hypothetical protein